MAGSCYYFGNHLTSGFAGGQVIKVEAIPFDTPFRPDVEHGKWASGGLDKADHVLIRVSGEDGLVGYGEAMPRPGFYGESQRGIVVAADDADIKNRAEQKRKIRPMDER